MGTRWLPDSMWKPVLPMFLVGIVRDVSGVLAGGPWATPALRWAWGSAPRWLFVVLPVVGSTVGKYL